MNSNYDGSDIVKLGFPDNIRMVPHMYYGTMDNADIALRETLDNCIDEMFKSECDSIQHIHEGKFHIVIDNGRGIPINWDEQEGKTKADLALSETHAGSNFGATSISTGVHGVGVAVNNALSEVFICFSRVTEMNYDKSIEAVEVDYLSDDKELYYYVRYEYGVKKEEDTIRLNQIKELLGNIEFKFTPSTIMAYVPDESIYSSVKTTPPVTNLSLAKLVFDKFYDRQINIYLMKDYDLNFGVNKYEVSTDIDASKYTDQNDIIRTYVSFEFSTDLSNSFYRGSVNSIHVDRGVHIRESQRAIRESLANVFGLDRAFHPYLTNGLHLTSIFLLFKAGYSAQIKDNLAKIPGWNAETYRVLYNSIYKVIKDNKEEFEDHVERVKAYVASLNKLKDTNYILSKVVLNDGNSRGRAWLPAKLRDCTTTNRMSAELYIVEGNSAAGNLVKTRDRTTQAILPLRGKPLNTIGSDVTRVLENEEMRDLINAIGLGTNGVSDGIDPRYGKIVIATDSDPDGLSISSLVLGTLANHVTRVFDLELVYLAIAPIYKQGDLYIYPDDDIDSLLDRNKPFERYKGLGSLEEYQIYDTVINPETRKLVKVTIDDLHGALEVLTSTSRKFNLMRQAGVL